jgi:hypothetical protein
VRALTFLFIAFVLSQPAMAQTKVPLRIGQGALIGAQVFDVQSTWEGLSRGYREVNPVLGGSPGSALAVKCAMTAGIVALSEVAWRKGKRKTAVIALVIAAAIPTISSIHNVKVMR